MPAGSLLWCEIGTFYSHADNGEMYKVYVARANGAEFIGIKSFKIDDVHTLFVEWSIWETFVLGALPILQALEHHDNGLYYYNADCPLIFCEDDARKFGCFNADSPIGVHFVLERITNGIHKEIRVPYRLWKEIASTALPRIPEARRRLANAAQNQTLKDSTEVIDSLSFRLDALHFAPSSNINSAQLLESIEAITSQIGALQFA